MTRMRATHNFHATKAPKPETFCTKCGLATPQVCEWCGACKDCHTGQHAEKSY